MAGNIANLTHMGKGRPKGSKNKKSPTRLTFTTALDEVIAKQSKNWVALLSKALEEDLASTDWKQRQGIMKIILDKFYISVEKQYEVEEEIESGLYSREQYDDMVNKLGEFVAKQKGQSNGLEITSTEGQ